MTDMEKIENMTIVEYQWRTEAKRIRDFDKTHELHQAAFLNQVAGSTEKVGKDVVPKYKTMNEFFNVTKRREEILGNMYAEKEPPRLSRYQRLILQANT